MKRIVRIAGDENMFSTTDIGKTLRKAGPDRVLRVQDTAIVEDWMLTLADVAKCAGKPLAIDVETTGLNWWQHKTIGVGIHCPQADVSGYFPTHAPGELEAIVQVMLDEWDADTWVIAHNLKFEWHFLGLDPFALPWKWLDSMIMVHLVDSRYKKSLMEAERIFLAGAATKKWHVEQAPKRKKIWDWPERIRALYCINDCVVTYDVCQVLLDKIYTLELWELLQQDLVYLKELWATERRGWRIDPEFVTNAQTVLNDILAEREQELYDSIGYTFNWRSHKQLSQALYEGMGWPRPVNPFKDEKSKIDTQRLYNDTMTSTFILMEKAKHPLGELISFMRETQVLRNNVKKWLALRDEDDVVHPNFKITGTRTGRLSCSNPNFQNIPSEVRTRFTQSVYSGSKSRSGEYNLRNAFIARPGMRLVAVDWRQMEMRMFGILSQDPNMLPGLMTGADNHQMIAEGIWGHEPNYKGMQKTYREWAKTISFGLIYGMTTGSVMHRLNLSWTEADEVSGQYWAAFPRVQPWLQEIVGDCKAQGFIRYWSGRLWWEENPNFMYKGANAAIQGGCADILKTSVLRFTPWMRERFGDNAGIVNYIHDEFITEVPEDAVHETATKMQEAMNLEDLFGVPWFTDVKVGNAYGSLEEWTDDNS